MTKLRAALAAALVLTATSCGSGDAVSDTVSIEIGEPTPEATGILGGAYSIGNEVWVWSQPSRQISIIDPSTDMVIDTIDGDDMVSTSDMVEHNGLVYVPSFNGVHVFDVATRELAMVMEAPQSFHYEGVVIVGDRLFTSGGTVDVFALGSGALEQQIDAGSFLEPPVLIDGQIWVSSGEFGAENTITVIDPDALTVEHVRLDTSLANPPAGGDGTAWVSHSSASGEHGLARVDTDTLELIEMRRWASSSWTAEVDGVIWVHEATEDPRIVAFDSSGELLGSFPADESAGEPVVGDGVAWVPNGWSNEVLVIDLATLEVVERHGTRGFAISGVYADGRAWIDDGAGHVTVLDPPAKPE